MAQCSALSHSAFLSCNAEAAIQGTSSASFAGKDDPLKSVKGFARAPKRKGHHDEEMTEMEVSVAPLRPPPLLALC